VLDASVSVFLPVFAEKRNLNHPANGNKLGLKKVCD
jgi:hypothetical protein